MMRVFKLFTVAGLFIFGSLCAWSSNTKTEVNQVTTAVTLAEDVDYVVKSATPFGTGGSVNITNTEHAVLILEDVKPSDGITLLADHVLINGAKAQNDVNCQVKIYDHGCIIMPYARTIKPLTVYSEQNFEGDQCNDFGLENSGGFMNTLTTAKLNNRIRSFKLKRGYMVTFSLRANGRGYSQCFIAADKDLEMATLPAILDSTISSYRIFKWYDGSKKALANDTRAAACEALKVTSCYSFSLGEDRGVNCECVPHHIYEDWPSAAECGRVTYSPHLKTNNEPGNSADDHPQTVKQILDNWENLMATGMRLCSPSSHDGSLGHLREFLDSIDARGWRCDIIDLHCYWAESSFNEWSFKTQWVDRYHRPIWISEWVWGASWNTNGAFANGVSEADNAAAVQRICEKLNGWDYIERYYYWNSERDPSRLYKDGTLTAAGKYYANMHSGLGYNGKYNYAPKIPTQGSPQDLTVTYNKQTHTATLTWYEPNGEINKRHVVQRRLNESSRWEDLSDVQMEETAATYTYDDTNSAHGYQYRIYVIDVNGTTRSTKTVTALSNTLEAGDAISIGEKTLFVGGNVFINGDFDLGFYGWLNGNGEPISGQPYFQIVPVGGIDNGSYLQAYGHGTINSYFEQSIQTNFAIEPQTNYYLSVANCNSSSGGPRILLVNNDAQSIKLMLTNTDSKWISQTTSFNSEENTTLQVWLRNLNAKAQFDKLMLCRLFETQEEALADGVKCAQAKAQAFMAYNTLYADLNSELAEKIAQATTCDEIISLTNAAIKAYNNMPKLSAAITKAEALEEMHLYGDDILQEAIDLAKAAVWASDINTSLEALQDAIDTYLPLTSIDGVVKTPQFTSSSNWKVKCGTYTGGDQRTNSKDGVTFWNAWWSGLNASEGEDKTMEIQQELGTDKLNQGYSHGLYAIECKASTEHYCLSDQHAYITDGTTTSISPNLTADYFDLPTIEQEDRWQSLTTMPIYLDDNVKTTIGFIGSKQGATDNAWHEIGNTSNKGDLREGWWCATDFVLKFCPLYKKTVVPNQWGVICLPYAIHPSKDITFYQIAGVSSDYTQICVETIDEVEAGMPVIFKATTEEAVFNEYGTSVTEASEGPGNLRGYFNSARAATDYYILQEGQWNKIGSTRPTRPKYSALIRPFGTGQPVPVIADWSGETIPINGVTPEEIALASISQPFVTSENPVIYTIDGRRLDNNRQAKPGIYVISTNGKTNKIIIK